MSLVNASVGFLEVTLAQPDQKLEAVTGSPGFGVVFKQLPKDGRDSKTIRL